MKNGEVSINSTSYKGSDGKFAVVYGFKSNHVSINSTSYKGSDPLIILQRSSFMNKKVSINSTSYKGSDQDWLGITPKKMMFPLIPLPIKEAISTSICN